MASDITLIIATIPGRERDLENALVSVSAQTLAPYRVIVESDPKRTGAATTRNRALNDVETEYVAFMDDDDILYPNHLEILREHIGDYDLAYPWFDLERLGVIDNTYDPLAAQYDGQLCSPFGREFRDEQRTYLLQTANFIPITHLSRSEVVLSVGGFPIPKTDEWPMPDCEDWGLHIRMLRAGAQFVHVPVRTWKWRHHGKNTSGRGK